MRIWLLEAANIKSSFVLSLCKNLSQTLSHKVDSTVNIALFSCGYPPAQLGGAELHTYRLARTFREMGHEPHVISVGQDVDGFSDSFDNEIPVWRLPVPHEATRYFCSGEHDRWTSRFLTEKRIDCAFLGLSWQLLGGIKALRDGQIPFVYYAHCYDLVCLQSNLQFQRTRYKCQNTAQKNDCLICMSGYPRKQIEIIKFLRKLTPASCRSSRIGFIRAIENEYVQMQEWQRLLVNHARWIYCPSDYTRNQLITRLGRSDIIKTVKNGVDFSAFTSEEPPLARIDDAIRFVYIGRLDTLKGLEEAIIAVQKLPSVIRVRYDIYAPMKNPHDRSYLDKLTKLLDGVDRVRFHTELSPTQVRSVYVNSDALLLATWSDTLSTQIQEALACRIPVICSDVDGNPEMVKHGVNGLLFPVGNANALTATLQRFCLDPELRHQLRFGAVPLWGTAECAEQFCSDMQQYFGCSF